MLFLKSSFQNLDGIIKVIFSKLIIYFVDCGLNDATAFFVFRPFRKYKIQLFVLSRRTIILFIYGVVVARFLFTLWWAFLLLLFLEVYGLSFYFRFFFIWQFRTVFKECFFLWQRSRVRSHVICLLSIKVVLVFFNPLDMVGRLVNPDFLLRHEQLKFKYYEIHIEVISVR